VKPIIFSTDMVKAILDGRKTQTRRVIKPQPTVYTSGSNISSLTWQKTPSSTIIHTGQPSLDIIRQTLTELCPYGQVGGKLWVRETFWVDDELNAVLPVYIHYRADHHLEVIAKSIKWRPSIFMPRWASRITLEITEIRVERVQEISYEDARAEGILRFDSDHRDSNGGVGYNGGAPNLPMRYESTAAFIDLWDSINAKRGYGWSVNPWVWCLTFKREG